MLKAVKDVSRNGMLIYRCRLCGHVFINGKQYAKHLVKSHLRNMSMNKRKAKKLYKRLLLIKIKQENNLELTNYEKYLLLKAKLNNIKL
ncbi:MAG: hypothetical protein ACP5G1_02395 [Nanopusillaceae archaeon]